MELEWRDLLKLYTPHILTALVALIGAIYTYGFEAGKREMLAASYRAAIEAKGE